MSTQHHERSERVKAVLVLTDGRAFKGTAFGAQTNAIGEVNFSTAMTGYQESLTDPATAGTLVALTFPHIGNTGMNTEDDQSGRIQAAGLIVRELTRRPSNWRSQTSLDHSLKDADVPGIEGIDTRALTRHIREHGVQTAGIFVGDDADKPLETLIEILKSEDLISTAEKTQQTYTIAPADHGFDGSAKVKITVVDYGVKKADLVSLASRGAELTVIPGSASAADIATTAADGIFLSDGSADPATMEHEISVVKKLLTVGTPILGISLGHVVLGLAAGAQLRTLKVGHHGTNLSVQDNETDKVLITAQSRKYALDLAGTNGIIQTHTSINDGVVEGIRLKDKNVSGIGFHPEGGPGPLDASNIFDQFISSLSAE